ncbi:hypothetical protein RHGRI_033586 [Rhododendron griersonianum]|uniref:TIR domain-containing protein n=1 Tax=Rhododendron griersonianum TaxID=479676 RepID=A0AAV6I0F9_9ERIC|nr:hypothetical protein RHGRI_033586 [Rhododendron griersonianum]
MSKGDVIASSLIDAIHDSAAAIAVISPSYASSRWCLEELATICECEGSFSPCSSTWTPRTCGGRKGRSKRTFEASRVGLRRKRSCGGEMRWERRVGSLVGFIRIGKPQ